MPPPSALRASAAWTDPRPPPKRPSLALTTHHPFTNPSTPPTKLLADSLTNLPPTTTPSLPVPRPPGPRLPACLLYSLTTLPPIYPQHHPFTCLLTYHPSTNHHSLPPALACLPPFHQPIHSTTLLPTPPQCPAPRSGCQMAVSLAQDAIFVHGGYSKVRRLWAFSNAAIYF